MNVTLSLDERTVEKARKRASALGKSLNQLIREYLASLAGEDEAERDISEFRRTAGKGKQSWRFNRDELYDRT